MTALGYGELAGGGLQGLDLCLWDEDRTMFGVDGLGFLDSDLSVSGEAVDNFARDSQILGGSSYGERFFHAHIIHREHRKCNIRA